MANQTYQSFGSAQPSTIAMPLRYAKSPTGTHMNSHPTLDYEPQVNAHEPCTPPRQRIPHADLMSLGYSAESHNGDYSTLHNASASPEPTEQQGKLTKHRRNYQACERCRERKVKCELGPVDAPHKPPCARCRRENKECFFASQRKKRRSESPESTDDGYDNGSHKRSRTISDSKQAPTSNPYSLNGQAYDQNSMHYQPVHPTLRPPAFNAQPELTAPTYRPNLNPNAQRETSRTSGSAVPKSEFGGGQIRSEGAEAVMNDAPATVNATFKELLDAAFKHAPVEDINATSMKMTGGPSLPSDEHLSPEKRQERLQAIKAWQSMRLIKVGFFRAEEAMDYLDYFYQRLQPMTPVVVPDFREPRSHVALLKQEPILTLTILLISSRYMRLSGYSQVSRSYEVHKHLWIALGTKIQRLILGQEQFGGGFTGAGMAQVKESASGQLTWPGTLRTLGTVEALLLLSDWQPRSLHFPPGDDDTQLLDGDYPELRDDDNPYNSGANPLGAQKGSPYASWLEPAWRSDRMSWMLLNVAQALAFELGVFDSFPDSAAHSNDPEIRRKYRIRRLVLVYTAQVSGRMGIPTALKIADWEPLNFTQGHTDPIDIMQHLWINIAGIMNRANREIFPSKEFTRNLTRGNAYTDSITTFAPLLASWKMHFEQVKLYVPEVMQWVLLMEYEYARLYINSLGLQQVVESWVRPDSDAGKRQAIMAKAVAKNKRYIDELTDAALHILDVAVNKLGEQGLVRDAPVRTFLRTLSGMMFTLKRLSLGNHEKMVRRSIDLLERIISLMTDQVVDDVHLCASTARLVQPILTKVKHTMIRVQNPTNTSSVPSRDHSRPQSPSQSGKMVTDNYGAVQAHSFPASVAPASSAYSLADPLASIPAKPMDDLADKMFVPPPNFNFQTNDFDVTFMDDANIDHSVTSDNQNDWLALDLSNLFNKRDFQVDQGSYSTGPMVGEQDMLEILTNSPTQMRWSSTGQQYSHY